LFYAVDNAQKILMSSFEDHCIGFYSSHWQIISLILFPLYLHSTDAAWMFVL